MPREGRSARESRNTRRTGRSGSKASVPCRDDGLCPVGDAEFGQYCRDVVPDGFLGDPELSADGWVVQMTGQQCEDLDLAGRQFGNAAALPGGGVSK